MVQKTRTDLLNFLAEKYNLQRYLEIGVQVPGLNFDNVKCGYKVGVDPADDIWSDQGTIFQMTSDVFLNEAAYSLGYNDNQFDLIFIDGLHTAEQVKKDFEGCLKYLSPNGFICLHDCNPLKEEYTIVPRPTPTGHWNGSCYKFAILLTSKYVTNDRAVTVDIDNGMVVYQAGQAYRGAEVEASIEWSDFDTNRKELLNLISWDEFITTHSHV